MSEGGQIGNKNAGIYRCENKRVRFVKAHWDRLLARHNQPYTPDEAVRHLREGIGEFRTLLTNKRDFIRAPR